VAQGVIVGDSVAQGQGVKLEESFGRVLERTLNDLSPKNRYEVIVLARTGYSTSQELILLEKEAFLYDPDVIIWSYVLNDPAHPVYHNANGELGRYFYEPKLHLLDFVLKKLFFIAEELKGKNCEKEYHKFLHCVYWDEVQANINKIGEISKRRKTPLIVLVHPVFEKGESFREYTLTALHTRLSEISSKAGLIPVDLLDAYRQYNPNEIKQHNKNGFNVWHPNAKGHEIIADHLFKKLKSDGLTQLQ
jgi:lysophospholipase L1-like esterase